MLRVLPLKGCTVLLAFLLSALAIGSAPAAQPDTLPALTNNQAPGNLDEMWSGFDPRDEPLEVERLHQWEEDGVVLRVVRFRIGIFKGHKATLAAVYGFPQGATDVPGLVQIHGGGQYADYKACLTNAKRGYATVSIAWAGRISAPQYRVGPDQVKLFWDQETDAPDFKSTTDWGAVDGYHAPSRNAGNQFPSGKAAPWTLDPVESPRNSGWFLCAVAARRALTFLEQQPEVDPERLGVYGHSMGGKLTVLTAIDDRIKAAAPSCGGISDRYNDSELFRNTLGDDVSLKHITCPIIFLSPANDFHGRIGDLPKAVQEIQSRQWRVTCSPHHNHQDTAPYEAATLLWFDQHLKRSFAFPATPATNLTLQTPDGIPTIRIDADSSLPIESVDVYYTQDGKPNETPRDRNDVVHRFWHHVAAKRQDESRVGSLPISSTKKPLWVYANVTYTLPKPVEGAGYYYRQYRSETINLSSLLLTIPPQQLRQSGVTATRQSQTVIEDFAGDWQKEWFSYRPDQWARTTNKLNADVYHAPTGAVLAFDVKADQKNALVVLIDDHAAEVQLDGRDSWQHVVLTPADLRNATDQPLANWENVRQLTLSATERLKSGQRRDPKTRIVGGQWKGPPPQFRNLRWVSKKTTVD
ncbi:hypothetical protein CKO51_03385 [Rhodopirellula sp. SM50]|nr:dienelactone hydrolase family protein [Rhodopirellula sp. SM50]PAY20934.1 hypothetical protein CKO51_03385 [Rhodopirellula sp. SM50]